MDPAKSDDLEQAVHKTVLRYLNETLATGFLKPKIWLVEAMSSREAAVEIARYAEKNHASFIFANTQAKKTWNPFRLGGFVETLTAISKVPVFVLNPLVVSIEKPSSILFPTDFSRDSRNALMKLEPYVQAFNAKILIYNQVENINFYPSAEFNGMWQVENFDLKLIESKVEQNRKKLAINWSKVLKEKNISSSALVRRQKKFVSADILEVAQSKSIGLIAMSNHSGSFTQAVLGSVARDILLQAKCPVIIFCRQKPTRKHMSKTEKTSQLRAKNEYPWTAQNSLPGDR